MDRRSKQLLKTPEESGDSDVSIIQSVPGAGTGITPILLPEASRVIRERDYHPFRCLAGTAPVTVQSAKRRMVSMRQVWNGRLRQALHHSATISVICDETSRKHYDRLRTAGHQHARALRGPADRLLRMLIAMLKYQTSSTFSDAKTPPFSNSVFSRAAPRNRVWQILMSGWPTIQEFRRKQCAASRQAFAQFLWTVAFHGPLELVNKKAALAKVLQQHDVRTVLVHLSVQNPLLVRRYGEAGHALHRRFCQASKWLDPAGMKIEKTQ